MISFNLKQLTIHPMLSVKNIRKSFTVCCLTLLSICPAILSSCSKDEPTPISDDSSRSVLIYIAAENSLYSYASADVQEILSAVSVMGDNDHVILYVDDRSLPRIYDINKNTTALTLSNLTPVKSYSEDMDSASPETLNKVLDYFFTNYSADSYGLVMWSHGSGWIGSSTSAASVKSMSSPKKTFAVDNNSNTSSNIGSKMNITDMDSVLDNYPKFKYIMFDACFMQSIEVAYELRGNADYIIGSPAEIPANGAPYHKILAPLLADDFSAQTLISDYYNYYGSLSGVVISAIKTDAFDSFVSTMKTIFDKYRFLDVSLYDDCLDYYMYEWNYAIGVIAKSPDYFDIQGIMKCVLSSGDYTTWKTAYDKLVPYSFAASSWYSAFGKGYIPVDSEQYGGVSMYLPLSKYQDDFYYDYYYETQWGKLFSIN